MKEYPKDVLPFINFYQYPPANPITNYTALNENYNLLSNQVKLTSHDPIYSIYVGIPFCRVKCNSCPFFNQLATDSKTGIYVEYIESVLNQIKKLHESKLLENRTCKAIYVGGGTASLLEVSDLTAILNSISVRFDLTEEIEITLEGNPKDFTYEYLKAVKDIGVNRVSIGIQSFSNNSLNSLVLNSPHDSEESFNSIKYATKLKFNFVNIDLLYGLPNQSLNDWKRELETVLKYNIQSITTNHYVIHKGSKTETIINRKLVNDPDEKSIDWNVFTKTILKENGYFENRYETYSKPGFIQVYSRCCYANAYDIIGLGAGAYSFINNKTISAPSNTKQYVAMINQGFTFPMVKISDRANEKQLMERLIIFNLMEGVIDKEFFYNRFITYPEIAFPELIKELLDYNLIEISKSKIKLTENASKYRKQIMAKFYSFNIKT